MPTGYRYIIEPEGGGENQIPFREIQSPAYTATIALKASDPRSEDIKVNIGVLTGALALSMDVTLPYALDKLTIVFTADGTNRTVTFGAGFSQITTLIVTASTSASVSFIYNGTTWSALGASVTGSVTTTTVTATTEVDTPAVKAITPLVTTPVGTVSIVEYTTGRDVTTVLTLTNFIVGALAGAAAALGLGNIVCAFPAGAHLELVFYTSLSLKAAGTAVAVADTGLGSVIASGAVSVLDGTATFEDRLTGYTLATSSTGGTAAASLVGATAGIGTGIALNIAASIKNVFLNSAATWNANNTGNLTATGTITLKWVKMEA